MMYVHLCLHLAVLTAPQPASTEPLLEFIRAGEQKLSPVGLARAALESAPEIDAARRRVEAAESRRDRLEVGLYPRFEATASASRLVLQEASASNQRFEFDIPRNRASIKGSLRYSLTGLFLEVMPTLDAESARVRAARIEREVTRADLALRTHEAFWRLVRARGTVWVAKSSLREARASRDQLTTLGESGLATPADVAAAEARFEARVEDVLAAENQRSIAREDLSLLTEVEIPPTTGVQGSVLDVPSPPTRSVQALEAIARRQRAELRSLRALHQELGGRRRSLRGRALPELVLQAEGEYAHPNPNIIPPEEEFSGSGVFGAVISWSPSDLASASAERDELDAELARVRDEWKRVWRQIRFSIRSQLSQLEVSLRRTEAARSRIEAAAEAFRTRRVAFENDRGLYTEVLAAEAELNRARQAFLFGLVDAHLAEARLARAVGRTLVEDPQLGSGK
jgi:outer membrane protein TolC